MKHSQEWFNKAVYERFESFYIGKISAQQDKIVKTKIGQLYKKVSQQNFDEKTIDSFIEDIEKSPGALDYFIRTNIERAKVRFISHCRKVSVSVSKFKKSDTSIAVDTADISTARGLPADGTPVLEVKEYTHSDFFVDNIIDEGYEGDASPSGRPKPDDPTARQLKLNPHPVVKSPAKPPIPLTSSPSIFKSLRVELPTGSSTLRRVQIQRQPSYTAPSVITQETEEQLVNTHAHHNKPGDAYDRFSTILNSKRKTILSNHKDIRVADSLSRLLSVKASKCCAVSILKKSQLKPGSRLHREMPASDKLLISYNAPDTRTHISIDHCKSYGAVKLELIRQFIVNYKQIRVDAKASYKTHGNKDNYKREINQKRYSSAEETVRAIMDEKNGGCGNFGKGTPKQIKERLIKDLMKVSQRVDFPALQEFHLHPWSKRQGSHHAEQNIMQYYRSIADELIPKQAIPIGCEKLHCFDCEATEIFFYDTDLKFLGRGCNSIKFPRTYNFIEDPRIGKQNCHSCVGFFQQGKALLESRGKLLSPSAPGQNKNLYASDSDSGLDGLRARSPSKSP